VRDWLGHLEACDVPCAPVASVGEALESEQSKARGIVFEVDHPSAGRHRSVGTPLRSDGTPWRSPRPSPTLGEHTAAVLREWAGYDDAQIAATSAATGAE